MSNPLTSRWTSREGARVVQEAFTRLVDGGSLDALGLATHDGRLDLRGIRFPQPTTGASRPVGRVTVARLAGVVQVHGRRWEGIDFGGAKLAHLKFYDSVLVDCRFERADCQRWGSWGTTIASCGFTGANLRNAAWGPGGTAPNVLRDCELRGADLRGASIHRLSIDGCDFSQARLDKVRFEQCPIARCRFAGRLPEVVFDGRDLGQDLQGNERPAPPELHAVDFRDAVFELTEFKGYRLDDVTLPADEDIRLVPRYRAVATRGLRLLSGDTSREAKILTAMLDNSLRGPVRDEDAAVFNRRDYLDLMGVGNVELARLASEVFTRAQAEAG